MPVIEVTRTNQFFLSPEKYVINTFSNLCSSVYAYFFTNIGLRGQGEGPSLCPSLELPEK